MAPEGGYAAFVPALPVGHTQGETLEETERNVKEAMALYLESSANHGLGGRVGLLLPQRRYRVRFERPAGRHIAGH